MFYFWGVGWDLEGGWKKVNPNKINIVRHSLTNQTSRRCLLLLNKWTKTSGNCNKPRGKFTTGQGREIEKSVSDKYIWMEEFYLPKIYIYHLSDILSAVWQKFRFQTRTLPGFSVYFVFFFIFFLFNFLVITEEY